MGESVLQGLGESLAREALKKDDGESEDSGRPSEGLRSVAREMISALERKDEDEVARLMRRSFEMQTSQR